MKRLFKLFANKKPQTITVVSGLPRSGTSLMMKMLEAGGIPPLTDNKRTPDEDNPKGYYEFEKVKQLAHGDTSWLDNVDGKVVKIISALLPYLPASYNFRIIFMERKINEILISQKKMLVRRGEDTKKIDDEELSLLFKEHLQEIYSFLHEHSDTIKYLTVNYNDLLNNEISIISSVNELLGGNLNIDGMARVIDPSLYRSKDTSIAQ